MVDSTPTSGRPTSSGASSAPTLYRHLLRHRPSIARLSLPHFFCGGTPLGTPLRRRAMPSCTSFHRIDSPAIRLRRTHSFRNVRNPVTLLGGRRSNRPCQCHLRRSLLPPARASSTSHKAVFETDASHIRASLPPVPRRQGDTLRHQQTSESIYTRRIGRALAITMRRRVRNPIGDRHARPKRPL